MADHGDSRTDAAVRSPLLPGPRGLGPTTAWALGLAAVWGALLLLAACTFPVSPSSSGGTQTLVQANGAWAVVVLAFPLLVVVLVWLLLRARRSWPVAATLAWVVTGALAVLTVLALLSVGLFVLPVVVALVVACAAVAPPD